MVKDKKAAFWRDLNFDTSRYGDISSLYCSFILFAADRTEAPLPVAGILEVAMALIAKAHELPWTLEAEVLAPQWLLARCLLPKETDGSKIRVVSQFKSAGIDQARTFAELFGKWMFARHGHRKRVNVVSAESRFTKSFWFQLILAKRLADKVRSQCPGFQLWLGGGYELFQRALERVGEAEKAKVDESAGHNGQSRNVNCAATTIIARSAQPDFGELSPLWKWTWPGRKSILDFSCRMLEASSIDEEYESIVSGLPARPKDLKLPSKGEEAEAELLGDSLIAEWNACKESGKV
jgi:hypothetical protein